MVIGIDASRAETADRTGVERYSFEIIRALRATLPAEASVVLYSRAPLAPELGPWGPRWENRVLGWRPRFLWTQLRLSFEMARRPPDVLFVPSALLPRVLPKRSVTTIHDATFVSHPRLYPTIERFTRMAGLRDACRRATTVIVPSQFAAHQIARYRGSGGVVIPLGVNTPSPAPPRLGEGSNPLLWGGEIERRKKYFLALGRIDKKKNLPIAIDAFARFAQTHPDHTLKFIGKFDFGAHEIVAYAQKSGVVDRIAFLGAVPDAKLAGEITGAVALLHPCPVEGFGLPVIEAMAFGTPVIVAEGGGAHEVAGDAALVCASSDVAAWAEAMGQVSYDMVRRSLIERGRARAVQFDWARAANGTWKALLG